MSSAFGYPSKIAVLGGRSEIGEAIVKEIKGHNPHAKTAACVRNPQSGEIEFDATKPGSAEKALEEAKTLLGDIDCVIIAFGVLGSESENLDNPRRAGEVASTNYSGAVEAGVASGSILSRRGGGCIVYLSSIAGVRVRGNMSVYGSSKLGADAFYRSASNKWAQSGVKTVVVRPGYVRTKMTSRIREPLGAVEAGDVARVVVDGIGEPGVLQIVYTSTLLKLVAKIFKILPNYIWNRIKI